MYSKFTLAVIFGLCTIQIVAQYTIKSPPFNLVLITDDPTWNSTALYACHEGAAIESLCASPDDTPIIAPSNNESLTYNLNITTPSNSSIGEPGLLTWVLPSGSGNYTEVLGLSYGIISNVAMPFFGTGVEQEVAFDDEGLLNIQSSGEIDTVSPPIEGGLVAYYRWFICLTNPQGYQYWTLVWVIGASAPENPSCVSVDVQRWFL